MTGRAAWVLAGALLVAGAPMLHDDALGATAPEWVRQAVAEPVTLDLSGAKIVHLLREGGVVLDEGGKARVNRRGAIRILTPDGKAEAVAAVRYLQSDRVRSLRAWVIRASGDVKALGDDDALDMALVGEDLYNESRVRSIVATNEVEPGAIFAFESELESRFLFRDFEWAFQDEHPACRSRFTISAPPGWNVKASLFNYPSDAPLRRGIESIWELRNLPAIPDEPWRPELTSLVPRLALSAIPPQGGPKDARSFVRWDDLAAWLWEFTNGRSDTSPRISALAQEISRTNPKEIDKIRAVAARVQALRYVSIQLGMGRGGGYVPHAASEVLVHGFGDCKDKAKLMRALLRELGIPAYLLLVYQSDASYVRDEWPSAQQFNHCILAARISEPMDGPVLDHPALGRLLVFDPTDEATPFGDLPLSEQGSLALLVTREPGSLVRLPVLPADRNRSERRNEITLGGDGSVHVVVREHSTGQEGAAERRLFRSLSSRDYAERIESWLTAAMVSPSIKRVEPMDRTSDGTFDLTLEFSALRYASTMPGGLMLFRPALLDLWNRVAFSAAERRLPLVLPGHTFRETSLFRIPEEYRIDELPAPVRLETPYGRYALEIASVESEQAIQVSREITLTAGTVPASEYPTVRSFYGKLQEAEQAMVVLVKK